MYIGFKHLHSTIGLLFLIVFAFILVTYLIGWSGNAAYRKGHRTSALIGLILSHLQLLFGLVLYFVSPLGLSAMSGETMKEPLARLIAVEHPLTNIIAIALITIGYSKAKKALTDKSKFSKILVFYGIGLVLILSRLPWQTWSLLN